MKFSDTTFWQLPLEILIDWCLMPTLAVFQLYRGMKFFYYWLRHLQDLRINYFV
jgi:hypothetical protein